MDYLFPIAFFAVGIAAGVFGGLLGLSGGVVTIPSLALIFHFMDFPQSHAIHTAIGTSLSAMVINGIASVAAHQTHKTVMWGVVFMTTPGLLLGSLLGSSLAHLIPGVLLQIIFGLFICILGTYVLLRKKEAKERKQPDKTLHMSTGFAIGTVASMLGVGGGVFTVPLLISHHHSPLKAVGTSSAIGLVITFIATMAYVYFGHSEIDLPWHIGYIYLPAFAIIGLTTLFSARVGVKLAHKIEQNKLKKIFAITLILIGIFMIF